MRAADVDFERRRRVLPGLADVRGAGAVVDGVGFDRRDRLAHCVRIDDIDGLPRDPVARSRRLAAGTVPGDEI